MINIINNDNINILKEFIKLNDSKYFRYYDKRNTDIIKNHLITIILTDNDNNIIGYSHIDNENSINWFGICILDKYKGNGNGKKCINYMIDYINKNNIKNVKLSVDIENYIAVKLYLKNNFYIKEIHNTYYIMEYDKNIELPVSMGEGLDKLTILDIKMKKLKDDRKIDVETEFNLLNEKLEIYKNEYIFYYNILLEINENIWDMQDIFRDSNDTDEQNKLCIEIIKENDNRFRVKKKINNISKSNIKEQKGYDLKTAFVLTHLGLGDNITSIGAVRYLSIQYDKVYVVCKEQYKKNMELLYSDDETIQLYVVKGDSEISPNLGFDYNKFKEITKNMDIYLAGEHLLTKNPNPCDDLPFNFYRDMNINESYFWKYFHVPTLKQSNDLLQLLKLNKEYIFIHNSASNGIIFNIREVENKFKFNKNDILIVNPCINVYNKGEPLFDIAEKFLNHPLPYYIDIIKNAKKVIMTDSSFFCLVIQQPLLSSEIYLRARGGRDYSYLNNKQKNNILIL